MKAKRCPNCYCCVGTEDLKCSSCGQTLKLKASGVKVGVLRCQHCFKVVPDGVRKCPHCRKVLVASKVAQGEAAPRSYGRAVLVGLVGSIPICISMLIFCEPSPSSSSKSHSHKKEFTKRVPDEKLTKPESTASVSQESSPDNPVIQAVKDFRQGWKEGVEELKAEEERMKSLRVGFSSKTPKMQAEFMSNIHSFARQYASEKNAIRATRIRNENRRIFISELFGNDPSFTNWVGQLTRLETQEDGDAMITVSLSPTISLQTKESVFGNGTRLKVSSSSYEVLADAKIGDWLLVSGRFEKGQQDHIRIPGLHGERDTMENPVFECAFTNITAVTD